MRELFRHHVFIGQENKNHSAIMRYLVQHRSGAEGRVIDNDNIKAPTTTGILLVRFIKLNQSARKIAIAHLG